VTAAQTLLYITVPANKVVEVLSIDITNSSNETNEQCEATLHLVSSLGTPTAATITPSKLEQGDQAASSLVKGPVTASEPTYTSSPNIEVGRKGFASLAGYQFAPVPEERPQLAGGASWGLRLLNSPSSVDLVVDFRFREIG
jgi:hypothetical protein